MTLLPRPLLAFVMMAALAFKMGLGKCLSDFEVQALNPTKVMLSWRYNCSRIDGVAIKRVRFKAYYRHKKWLACGRSKKVDSSRGTGKGNLEVADPTRSLVFSGLNPYSRYDFSVKAILEMEATEVEDEDNERRRWPPPPEEQEVVFTTPEDVPNVKPIESSVATNVGVTDLRFFWRQPLPSECNHFRSKLSGFHLVLRGADRWNKDDPVQRNHTLFNLTTHKFEGLRPMSKYQLSVFAVNSQGQTDPVAALVLEATTRESDQPRHPPRDLKAVPVQGGGFKVSWLPPYPPSAPISRYELRWKEAGEEEWKDNNYFIALPGSDLCQGEGQDELELTCLTVEDLRTTSNEGGRQVQLLTNVTFQVSAVSPQRLRSPWSAALDLVENDNENAGNDGPLEASLIAAILVSIGVILVVIVVAVIAKHKCRSGHRRKGRYSDVLQYQLYPTKPPPPSSSAFSTATHSLALRRPEHAAAAAAADRSTIASFGSGSMMTATATATSRPSPPTSSPPPAPTSISSSSQSTAAAPAAAAAADSSISSVSIIHPVVSGVKDYSHLLLPIRRMPSEPGTNATTTSSSSGGGGGASQTDGGATGTGSSAGSGLPRPLPPLPLAGNEPIYEELTQETLLRRRGSLVLAPEPFNAAPIDQSIGGATFGATIGATIGDGGAASDDEFLKPTTVNGSTNSSDYLKPDAFIRRGMSTSSNANDADADADEEEDEEEYLKPTFNQLPAIDPRDMSPPQEKAPQIPIQSYIQPTPPPSTAASTSNNLHKT